MLKVSIRFNMLSFISGLSQRSGNPATYIWAFRFRASALSRRLSYLITVCPSVLFARSLVPHRKTNLSLSLYPAFKSRNSVNRGTTFDICTCFPDPFLKRIPIPVPRELLIIVVFPIVAGFFTFGSVDTWITAGDSGLLEVTPLTSVAWGAGVHVLECLVDVMLFFLHFFTVLLCLLIFFFFCVILLWYLSDHDTKCIPMFIVMTFVWMCWRTPSCPRSNKSIYIIFYKVEAEAWLLCLTQCF